MCLVFWHCWPSSFLWDTSTNNFANKKWSIFQDTDLLAQQQSHLPGHRCACIHKLVLWVPQLGRPLPGGQSHHCPNPSLQRLPPSGHPRWSPPVGTLQVPPSQHIERTALGRSGNSGAPGWRRNIRPPWPRRELPSDWPSAGPVAATKIGAFEGCAAQRAPQDATNSRPWQVVT